MILEESLPTPGSVETVHVFSRRLPSPSGKEEKTTTREARPGQNLGQVQDVSIFFSVSLSSHQADPKLKSHPSC